MKIKRLATVKNLKQHKRRVRGSAGWRLSQMKIGEALSIADNPSRLEYHRRMFYAAALRDGVRIKTHLMESNGRLVLGIERTG